MRGQTMQKEEAVEPFETDGKRHAHGVALMFEGGGMRASYTAGAAVTLLEQGISFDFVCGVSAGSSHAADFLSGDVWRTRTSFVDFAADPNFGGVKTFLQGKGIFSADWIYRESGKPGQPLPFDFDAYAANPTPLGVQAFDRETGKTKVWGREDMATLDDLMVRVQASSSLPVAMPPTRVGGHTYYDGGLGTGGGIPLQMALDSGCERVFAVLTRPRGYRKPWPDIGLGQRAVAERFRMHPAVREALLSRNRRYNEELERLEALAAEGRALIVYADEMAVTSSTTDVGRLRESYARGYAQAQRELPAWREWLGV